MSQTCQNMSTVDEYKLSEKRKRTGDMFQSLKLGSMMSNGTLLTLFRSPCRHVIMMLAVVVLSLCRVCWNFSDDP